MASPHEDRINYPDTVRIERHRTDWVAGVAFVFDPDGVLVTQFDTGSAKRFQQFSYPPGTIFSVRVITYDGPDVHDETFRFEVGGDPDAGDRHWLGPGITTVPTKRGGTRDVGFEYGVTVWGARRLP